MSMAWPSAEASVLKRNTHRLSQAKACRCLAESNRKLRAATVKLLQQLFGNLHGVERGAFE